MDALVCYLKENFCSILIISILIIGCIFIKCYKWRRRRNHRSRWTSDNESELSKGSSRSHRKHRRHRSRSKKDSGSEQDVPSRRHRSSSR